MKLTDKQKIEIVEKYKIGGISCSKLAKEYGVSHTSICSILKVRNIPITHHPKNTNRKYFCNEHYFDSINTEAKAYFLGLMYADGCVFKKLDGFSILLIDSDIELLEIFKKEICYTGPLLFREVQKKYKTRKNAFSLVVTNEKLAVQLANLGCVPAKSLILQFPKNGQVPKELMRHFIRGYFDGDGSFCVYQNKKTKAVRYEVVIVSTIMFLEKMIQECNHLDINWEFKSRIPGKSTRHLRNRGYNKVYRFLDWIYKDATVFLKRKYDKYIQNKKE